MASELDRPRRARNKKVTEKDKEVFLEGIRSGMTLTQAAERASHPPESFFYRRKIEPEFAAQVQEAMDIGADVLLQEAQRRAVEGVQKPIIGKVAPGIDGQLKDENGNLLWETVHSDRILEFLIKGRLPDYKDNPKVQIDQKTLNVTIEDRSAALEDVAKVLREAGALENNRASDGEVISGAGLLLAESEDV